MLGNGIAIIKEHGTAYFLEGKSLACAPLCEGGGIDMESSGVVEESPTKFRDGHMKALQTLGVSPEKQQYYLEKIIYYEE